MYAYAKHPGNQQSNQDGKVKRSAGEKLSNQSMPLQVANARHYTTKKTNVEDGTGINKLGFLSNEKAELLFEIGQSNAQSNLRMIRSKKTFATCGSKCLPT